MKQMTEATRWDVPKRDVVLIGRNNFQNKLLAHLIDERIGCSCLVRAIEDCSALSVDADQFALLDIEGVAAQDISVRLQGFATRVSCRDIAHLLPRLLGGEPRQGHPRHFQRRVLAPEKNAVRPLGANERAQVSPPYGDDTPHPEGDRDPQAARRRQQQ